MLLLELGWIVDLSVHKGYCGRLDCDTFRNGQHMLYYTDDHVEVAYHVATMMPYVAHDDQQIEKKKHIGNDAVHIVWSENSYVFTLNKQAIDRSTERSVCLCACVCAHMQRGILPTYVVLRVCGCNHLHLSAT